MSVTLTATPRAVKDWDALPADTHAMYRRLFERLTHGAPLEIEKREGALAHELGVDDVFSVRASQKYRALMSRVDGGWRLEVLTSRGDKRYYRKE